MAVRCEVVRVTNDVWDNHLAPELRNFVMDYARSVSRNFLGRCLGILCVTSPDGTHQYFAGVSGNQQPPPSLNIAEPFHWCRYDDALRIASFQPLVNKNLETSSEAAAWAYAQRMVDQYRGSGVEEERNAAAEPIANIVCTLTKTWNGLDTRKLGLTAIKELFDAQVGRPTTEQARLVVQQARKKGCRSSLKIIEQSFPLVDGDNVTPEAEASARKKVVLAYFRIALCLKLNPDSIANVGRLLSLIDRAPLIAEFSRCAEDSVICSQIAQRALATAANATWHTFCVKTKDARAIKLFDVPRDWIERWLVERGQWEDNLYRRAGQTARVERFLRQAIARLSRNVLTDELYQDVDGLCTRMLQDIRTPAPEVPQVVPVDPHPHHCVLERFGNRRLDYQPLCDKCTAFFQERLNAVSAAARAAWP